MTLPPVRENLRVEELARNFTDIFLQNKLTVSLLARQVFLPPKYTDKEAKEEATHDKRHQWTEQNGEKEDERDANRKHFIINIDLDLKTRRQNSILVLFNSNICPFKWIRNGYFCYFCDVRFSEFEELKQHKNQCHLSPTQAELTKVLSNLKKYEMIKVDVSDLTCRVCNEKLEDVAVLKGHLLVKHNKNVDPKSDDGLLPLKINGKEYQCGLCEQNYEDFKALLHHMNIHFQNFICDFCGSAFITPCRLKKHIAIHETGSYNCEECGKVFRTVAAKTYHNATVHKGAKRHRCPQCFESFANYFQRMKHLQNVHDVKMKEFKCSMCDKVFYLSGKLGSHVRQVHMKMKRYSCDLCEWTFYSKSELKDHMLRHGGEKKYQCDVCKKAYARRYTLVEHMRIHQNDRRFVCAICGRGFIQKCSLKHHVKVHHPATLAMSSKYDDIVDGPKHRQASSIWALTSSERENAANLLQYTTLVPFIYSSYPLCFKCFYCNEQYSELEKLLQHTKTHSVPEKAILMKTSLRKGKKTVKVDISTLKCKICETSLNTIDNARNHLVQEHAKIFNASGNGMLAFSLESRNGVLSCHICSESFHSFFLLNKHVNVHYNNAICDTCGKSFVSYMRLLIHKKTHLKGQYPCQKCDVIFNSVNQLRYHNDKNHGKLEKVKPSKCHMCGDRFEHHYEKMKHLSKIHGIEFEFICEACNISFKTRKSLSSHTIKTHKQTISCDVCKKPFAERSHLRKHMAMHTEERNYSCPLCSKSYRYERNMKVHMRIHNPEWKFACSSCWIGFKSKIEYRRHIEQHEKGDKDERISK